MYIWEKYRTFEITSGIILKMNLPLYKGFTLEITNKWWLLTTLKRWPLYRIKIYSKMHRESTKVTIMSRWPLYKGDRYDRFHCISTDCCFSELPVRNQSVLVSYKAGIIIIISSKCNLFFLWYNWQIVNLMLHNNHSLTLIKI